MFESDSDERLMELYRAGEEHAFDELFERYRNRVFGYIHQHIRDPKAADDIFQTTFLKLHSSRAKYETGRSFGAWIFTICRNVIMDHLRHISRNMEDVNEAVIGRAESLAESPEKISEAGTMSQWIQKVPVNQGEALRLRYEEDLDFEGIARRLSTTQENARQLISRALRTLRKRVNK
ncbi:MAG: sigma-70 family RNA polymerase sigma factor [Deltaproteobacteria bacterium]|nr:sigma-70 family RNA polymerase sigma factor [Deltaproteobacteria bacterium]